MGAVASLEEKLGNLAQRLLMPKEAPAHYAVGRPSAFPEAPADSLLLLAHITLEATAGTLGGAAAARRFYVEGLGAREAVGAQLGADAFRAIAGPTQLRLSQPSGADSRGALSQVWPGHLYFWVEDSRAAYEACRALEASLGCELIEEVHNLRTETAVDLLVVKDPGATGQVMINAAPKGSLVELLRSLAPPPPEGEPPNLLVLIEATHLVAPGAGPAVARFYRHFLGAAVTRQRGGHAVHFSLGPALHQTLTFVEDESVAPVVQSMVGQAPVPGVCVYLPSREAFRQSHGRCSEAGVLLTGAAWAEAEGSCEFCFRSCPDPESPSKVVLELLHVVRIREHPEWPVAAGVQIGGGQGRVSAGHADARASAPAPPLEPAGVEDLQGTPTVAAPLTPATGGAESV